MHQTTASRQLALVVLRSPFDEALQWLSKSPRFAAAKSRNAHIRRHPQIDDVRKRILEFSPPADDGPCHDRRRKSAESPQDRAEPFSGRSFHRVWRQGRQPKIVIAIEKACSETHGQCFPQRRRAGAGGARYQDSQPSHVSVRRSNAKLARPWTWPMRRQKRWASVLCTGGAPSSVSQLFVGGHIAGELRRLVTKRCRTTSFPPIRIDGELRQIVACGCPTRSRFPEYVRLRPCLRLVVERAHWHYDGAAAARVMGQR
jgi:hypothetical protein